MTAVSAEALYVSFLSLLLVGALVALDVARRRRERERDARLVVMEAALAVLPGDTAASAASLATLRQRVETLEGASRSLNTRLLLTTERVDEQAVLVGQARTRAEQHQEALLALHETLGKALGGFKGLAVHGGPEHTPDLYVASRQNVAGVPKETWRCHQCAYREVRDASGTERTDLYRPELRPAEEPAPAPPAPAEPRPLPRTVVGQGESLIDAMRRRG